MECTVTGTAHRRDKYQSSAYSVEVSKSRTSTKREQGCIVIKDTEEMEKQRKCLEVMWYWLGEITPEVAWSWVEMRSGGSEIDLDVMDMTGWDPKQQWSHTTHGVSYSADWRQRSTKKLLCHSMWEQGCYPRTSLIMRCQPHHWLDHWHGLLQKSPWWMRAANGSYSHC